MTPKQVPPQVVYRCDTVNSNWKVFFLQSAYDFIKHQSIQQQIYVVIRTST